MAMQLRRWRSLPIALDGSGAQVTTSTANRLLDGATPAWPHLAIPDGLLLVLSPHLDDAVLSAGDLVSRHPDVLVATVFSEADDQSEPMAWDATCGLGAPREAMACRRAEDTRAMQVLSARSSWLGYVQPSYTGSRPAEAELAASFRRVLHDNRPSTVAIPLGLSHPDHEVVHRAARSLMDDVPALWLAYAEDPYRFITGELMQRLVDLQAAGIDATPCPLAVPDGAGPSRKREAVHCYTSQVRGLSTVYDISGILDHGPGESWWHLESADALD